MKAKKLVYGVGVNDADYTVNTIDATGKKVRCPIYTQWKNMMARCYAESTHKRQPTYIGCSVDVRWHSYMAFREWMLVQDYEGMHLDKDLLLEGNKVYGPDVCVFVSRATNMFISTNRARTGKGLLRGVVKSGTKYTTYEYRERVQVWTGRFDTQEEAHALYLILKERLSVELADEQDDPRVAEALIKRFALPR